MLCMRELLFRTKLQEKAKFPHYARHQSHAFFGPGNCALQLYTLRPSISSKFKPSRTLKKNIIREAKVGKKPNQID